MKQDDAIYIKQLNGVWHPWPLAWARTVEDCDAAWKKMQDQTSRFARTSRTPIIGTNEFQDGWNGLSIQRFFAKQKRGYDDCIAAVTEANCTMNLIEDGKITKAATPNQPVEIEQSIEPSDADHDHQEHLSFLHDNMLSIILIIATLISGMILASWQLRCHNRKKKRSSND